MLSIQFNDKNLHLLVLEVKKQVQESQLAIENVNSNFLDKTNTRDDYVDNLRSLIIQNSYKLLLHANESEKQIVPLVMAISTISNNLERIGDYTVNIIKQTGYLEDKSFFKDYKYSAYFEFVIEGLELTASCFRKLNLQKALVICNLESQLDDLVARDFSTILKKLEEGKSVKDLVTTLSIFRYLERMGDCLQNIGEAIVSAATGMKIRITDFEALKDSLELDPTQIKIEQVGGQTRSGCQIGKIESVASINSRTIVYKTGKKKKLQEEKRHLDWWSENTSNLTPKVVAFQETGKNASLVIDFIAGSNFQEIVTSAKPDTLEKSFVCLKATLTDLWQQTMETKISKNNFVKQLIGRMEEVLKMQPMYDISNSAVGNISRQALSKMLEQLKGIEETISCPYSVLVHGDFNIDNVIYNELENKVYFIDIHRSEIVDPVQDISVFLVSNFRIPIFSKRVRSKIEYITDNFLDFCRQFAKENDDLCFDARLSIGLIRSLITSTRFEADKEFANEMYYRALYLIEKLIERKKDWNNFVIPVDILKI